MVKYAREKLSDDKVIVHGQTMGAQTASIYAPGVTPVTKGDNYAIHFNKD